MLVEEEFSVKATIVAEEGNKNSLANIFSKTKFPCQG